MQTYHGTKSGLGPRNLKTNCPTCHETLTICSYIYLLDLIHYAKTGVYPSVNLSILYRKHEHSHLFVKKNFNHAPMSHINS